MNWLEEVRFDGNGLVPVIAQDAESGRVLMVAWANAGALAETVVTGQAVYFSRSRGKLWRKGEESGHVQKLRELRVDCDADTVLMKVEQVGGIACHTGRRSCFYRKLEGHAWRITDEVIREPGDIYRKQP